MTTRTSTYAACSAAGFALLLAAAPAAAQLGTPQRAPESLIAPAGAGPAAEDSGPIAPAPAPEQPGPLGEPAPPVLAPPVRVALDEAATAAEPAAAETPESARPIGEPIPLGAPVPAPPRRSFLPAIRTASRREAVPALGSGFGLTGAVFLEDQLTHERVVNAQLDAKFDLKALFAERGLTYPPRDIYFRLFKHEQVLEVWVRDAPQAETYTLLREYPICAVPGRLGPKTRNDDFQAPEGFYYIEGFNPESDYHLSLRLNYPNPADRIIGVEDSYGGDIYIHGGCSTVGCFPMTDEAMAELYWLAVEARAAGQNVIPVHVFPTRMHRQGMTFLRRTFERDARLVAFWENLREGYEWFESSRTLPVVSVDPAGRYVFAPAAPAAQGRPAAGAPAVEPGLLGEEVAPAGPPAAGVPAAEPATAEAPLPEPPAEDGPLGAALPATTP